MWGEEQGRGRIKQIAGRSGDRRGRGNVLHLNQTAGIHADSLRRIVRNVDGSSAGKLACAIATAPGTRGLS